MRITKHALERMKERSIKVGDIACVLRYGNKLVNKWDEKKLTFVDYTANLYVVTDDKLTTVITVFRKEV